MSTSAQLHSQRKLDPCLLIAGLICALHPLAAQDLGLGLNPMRTELHMAPGAAYTGTLRVINEGVPVRVRTSLLDFHLDAEQTPQFESQFPEEAAYSCRGWLTVNPMEVEMKASGETVVRYTLRVPPEAQPRSYYCAVGFTSMPPAVEGLSTGIRTAVRVVGALYVIVGQPAIQGRLSAISLEHAPGSKDLRAIVVLENSGEMYFRPSGSVAILDRGGQVLESYDFTPLPILPERKQRLVFPLKKLTAGQPGTVRVRVDIGTGEIQEGTAAIEAPGN